MLGSIKTYFLFYTCSISIVAIISSCQNSLVEEEEIAINQYVKSLSVTPDYVIDDVTIIISEAGNEEKPIVETSTVEVKYTASYLDGQIFDDRHSSEAVQLKLSTAIRGLKIGLPFIGKGGRAIMIIPSRHAYGNNPPRGIKGNSVLLYDISLIDF
jgi:FKBP-type peptidyl-prolyl cis-trans isomerase FkpA